MSGGSTESRMTTQLLRTLPYVLACMGVVVRLLPLLLEDRLYLRFPTDDGYYMLTIARNVALGLGMSVSMGEVPTNGTQPLTTYLYAVLYWLVDGDKAGGILLAHLVLTACACASAYLIYTLAVRLLPQRPWTTPVSVWLAALWFCSPVTVSMTMNMLETGPLLLVLLAFLHTFVKLGLLPLTHQTYVHWGSIGALLGLLFLTRNDMMFMAMAVVSHRLVLAATGTTADRKKVLLQAGIVVSVSGLIAMPWVAFNYFGFGHLMPISGMAEADMRFGTGGNISAALRAIAISMYAALPAIPFVLRAGLEQLPMVVTIAVVVAPFVAWIRWGRSSWPTETTDVAFVAVMYGGILCLFYTFFFGAPWFLVRYFFPLTPLLGIVAAGLAGTLATRSRRLRMRSCAAAGVVSTVLIGSGMGWRAFSAELPPRELSEWVSENVAEDVWVGAYQSGMLGYFHDRTINLDGKVNPSAYEARRAGTFREFVAQSQIEYIVDWCSIVMADAHNLTGNFALIAVEDSIVVLRRGVADSYRLGTGAVGTSLEYSDGFCERPSIAAASP